MARTLEAQQIDLERAATERGAAKYRASVQAAQTKFNELDTPPGERFTNRLMRKLVPTYRKLQRELKAQVDGTAGAKVPSHVTPILALPPDVLAVIVLRTAMTAGKENNFLTVCRQTARYVKLEIDWRALRAAERAAKKEDPEHFDLGEWWARKMKVPKPHLGQKWMRDIGALSDPWPLQRQAAVGAALIYRLVEACAAEFYIDEYVNRGRTMRTIRTLQLTDKARSGLDKVHDIVALLKPWRCPMVCPPKPWKAVKE